MSKADSPSTPRWHGARRGRSTRGLLGQTRIAGAIGARRWSLFRETGRYRPRAEADAALDSIRSPTVARRKLDAIR